MKFILFALISLASTPVFADQSEIVTAMACGDVNDTGRYAVIKLETAAVSKVSSKQHLLYSVEVGATSPKGKRFSKRVYAGASKARTFKSNEQAYQYVSRNAVVLPLTGEAGVSGVITIFKDKKTATLVDFADETSTEYSCLIN